MGGGGTNVVSYIGEAIRETKGLILAAILIEPDLVFFSQRRLMGPSRTALFGGKCLFYFIPVYV